jgi:7,8-dihydroneopterin aldolase/epimerase/oxygenase
MDSIIARGMTFQACHGLLPQEKNRPQKFKVDLVMGLDLHPAGTSDALDDTIDYDRVYHLVEAVVTGNSYNLIEALAERIAADLLAAFRRMQEVEVKVYKPEAPVVGEFEYFAVKVHRRQK